MVAETMPMIPEKTRMRRSRNTAVLSLAFLTAACAPLLAQTKANAASARDMFLQTPDDARPMVRWWWFGPAVQKAEILREMQQMKTDGIGGAELAFVYPMQLDDSSRGVRNLPFLSPEMLDAVKYAQSEGRRLGLRIDVTLCSGWPYGGPHIPLELAAGRLRTYEAEVPAGATSIRLPHIAEGETLISASLVEGQPKHWSADHIRPLAVPANSENPVAIEPANRARVALFFYAGHTRQMVKRAAVGAEGFVLDPFSSKAVATHLKAVGEPLLSAFGSTPPYAIFSDSLEAYGADWTPDLPAEFAKRRGYDLLPHLPELVAGGTPAADKVRHDFGVTLTELINQNYLVQINDWAKVHGTRFRSQTYGEPAVSFSSQKLVALPEGEGPQWRAFSTLRWATSANHVFGNNVTSGETFTWLHSPVFRATPLDMKAEADIDFLMGENQLMFHGWPYSPPASELPKGDPGSSLYAAAVFNDHNPWHPVMPAVTGYIARVSHLLREGQPANQVALLLPTDDAWTSFSPGKVTVTGAMNKLVPKELMDAILAAGYNVDFIDAEAIETVGLGTHQIVVLPPTDRIPPQTIAKLAAWTKSGGKILTVGRKPTLDPEGQPLGVAAWDAKLPGAVHAGDIASVPRALNSLADPDFAIVEDNESPHFVGFIRRKLPHADIYFVANTSNRAVSLSANFATAYKAGESIDPDSGDSTAASPRYAEFHLAPYGSRVFVFSDAPRAETPRKTKTHDLGDISSGWRVNFVGLNKSDTEHELKDWTADPATLHFSGEAVYARDVTVSAADLAAGKHVLIDIEGGAPEPGDPAVPSAEEHHVLGTDGLPNPLITKTGPGMHAYYNPPLHEAALVTVNGKAAGALWHPPYQLDLTAQLHAGVNHLELHVYNTALNAWSGISPRDFGPLKAKYGDRFQMQDLDRVKPLPSGILGPIHLVSEETQ